MIDNVKQHFMLAVQHSLEKVFDAEELAEETTLEANVGPIHRAFILVYDESAQPTQPCVPVPTIKLHDDGEVYFVYLLAEVEARGGEFAGEIVLQHPLGIAQNRPVEASAHWDQYELPRQFSKAYRGKEADGLVSESTAGICRCAWWM